MNLAVTDPRLLRLDYQVRTLGLTQAQTLNCLIFAVHVHCGERGRAAVRQLRAESEGSDVLRWNFDEFAAMAGITPNYLLTIFEAGLATFGGRFTTGALQ